MQCLRNAKERMRDPAFQERLGRGDAQLQKITCVMRAFMERRRL